MSAAGFIFLVILFGLNIWFIYFRFRQNEDLLKQDLEETKAKLFTEE